MSITLFLSFLSQKVFDFQKTQEKCFKVSLSTYKEPAPEINDIWNVKGAKETEISVRELIYLDKETKPQEKVKLLRK